eukprot:944712-Amphidinium_carterae.1
MIFTCVCQQSPKLEKQIQPEQLHCVVDHVAFAPSEPSLTKARLACTCKCEAGMAAIGSLLAALGCYGHVLSMNATNIATHIRCRVHNCEHKSGAGENRATVGRIAAYSIDGTESKI